MTGEPEHGMREDRGGFAAADLLRWWWLIAGAAAVAVLVAAGLHAALAREYQAEAAVLFRGTNVESALLDGTSYFERNNTPLGEAATNLRLAANVEIAERVAERLSLTPADVRERITFSRDGESQVIAIFATDRDPAAAQALANAWAEELVAFRRQTDRAQVDEAIRLIQDELPAAVSEAARDQLQQSLQRLRVVQALQTGGVEFVEPAVLPEDPKGPSLPVILLGALLVGGALGLGGAVILQKSDRRVRSADQAVRISGLPLLGVLPASRGELRSGGIAAGPLGESFKTLAFRLRFFDVDGECRTVAVVSSDSGEGKTVVSAGLAAGSTAVGRRSLLIDADLRKGGLRAFIGSPGQPGLPEALSAQCGWRDTVVPGPAFSTSLATPARHDEVVVDVIGGGATLPPNPMQMLASKAMRTVLQEAREEYEAVIIDTAPLLRVGDAEPLLGVVDGYVVVVRLGHSHVGQLRQLAELLRQCPGRPLGIIVNGDRAGRGSYGDYGRRPRERLDMRAT